MPGESITDDLVAVARIVKPRGLRGELIAELLTDFPERFETLKHVKAVEASGDTTELIIEDHWFQNGRLVLKFQGFDSVEGAETLRNAEICVAESEAVALKADEYYDWQLEHCDVNTVDGTHLGRVAEVMRTGGAELLVVRLPGKEYLIPFAESICVEVDIQGQRIVVDPPEGLLDF